MSNPDNRMPIGDALRVVAGELAELAKLGHQVETIIADLVGHTGKVSPDLLRRCQSADLLSQRLAGVAAFVDAVGQVAPANVTFDVLEAVRSVTLADQAHRLSGRRIAEAALPGGHGELALFED